MTIVYVDEQPSARGRVIILSLFAIICIYEAIALVWWLGFVIAMMPTYFLILWIDEYRRNKKRTSITKC